MDGNEFYALLTNLAANNDILISGLYVENIQSDDHVSVRFNFGQKLVQINIPKDGSMHGTLELIDMQCNGEHVEQPIPCWYDDPKSP